MKFTSPNMQYVIIVIIGLIAIGVAKYYNSLISEECKKGRAYCTEEERPNKNKSDNWLLGGVGLLYGGLFYRLFIIPIFND